jgi:hypothetical protein
MMSQVSLLLKENYTLPSLAILCQMSLDAEFESSIFLALSMQFANSFLLWHTQRLHQIEQYKFNAMSSG